MLIFILHLLLFEKKKKKIWLQFVANFRWFVTSFGTPLIYLPANLQELLHCKNIQKSWMQLIPVRHFVLQENKLSIINPLIPASLYQNHFHMRLRHQKLKLTALSSCQSGECIFNCRFKSCLSVHVLWIFWSAKEK